MSELSFVKDCWVWRSDKDVGSKLASNFSLSRAISQKKATALLQHLLIILRLPFHCLVCRHFA